MEHASNLHLKLVKILVEWQRKNVKSLQTVVSNIVQGGHLHSAELYLHQFRWQVVPQIKTTIIEMTNQCAMRTTVCQKHFNQYAHPSNSILARPVYIDTLVSGGNIVTYFLSRCRTVTISQNDLVGSARASEWVRWSKHQHRVADGLDCHWCNCSFRSFCYLEDHIVRKHNAHTRHTRR